MNMLRKIVSLYNMSTLVAALMACSASIIALLFSLPVWTMFIGWIAFFSKGLSMRYAIENLGCLWIGFIIGSIASSIIHSLTPSFGILIVLPVTVFVIALIVVSLRGLTILNNLVCYFLGLATWFAAHLEPQISSLMLLAGSTTIGVIAGYIAHHIPLAFVKFSKK